MLSTSMRSARSMRRACYNLAENFDVEAVELGFFINLRFVGVELLDFFFKALDSFDKSAELSGSDGHQTLVLTGCYLGLVT